MNTPTYETQWQKITEAYMRDEIEPYDCNFCFCGTIDNNSDEWAFTYSCVNKQYTYEQFHKMEDALLRTITETVGCEVSFDKKRTHPLFEEGLFNGMTAALEVLRQIHLAKGDPTAKTITLQKRQLV